MSFLLKIMWSILLLCLAVLLVFTAGLTFYQDEIEAKIANKVEEVTGRELQIQDGFGFRFNPLPSIYAKNIVLANASWGTKPWMLRVKETEVAFSFIALAQGKVKVSNIKVDSPYFLFERKQDRLNWFFGQSKKGESPKPLEKLYKYFLLNEALMDNAQFDVKISPRAHSIKLNRTIAKVKSENQTITIELVGSAENKLIQAEGTFTDVKSLLLREPSTLQLSGTYGEMPVTVQGTIDDVLRWQGINVTAKAIAPSLSFFQPWNQLKLPDTPPITATARLLQPNRWGSAHLEDIELTMNGFGGTTSMTGAFKNLQSWDGLDLSGISSHGALPLLQKMGWAGNQDAMINARYSLSGAIFKGLTFNLTQANLTGHGIVAEANGTIDNLSAVNSSAISITAEANSLHHVGELVGRSWPVTEPIKAIGQLTRKDGAYGFYQLEGSAYEGDVTVSGYVDRMGSFATGEFDAQGLLNAADIATFNQQNDYLLPEADSAQITANIQYDNKLFSAKEVAIELMLDKSTINARGAIDDMAVMQLRDTSLVIDVPSVTPFNQLYDLKLPELGRLTATADLEGNFKEKYSLVNLIGNFKNNNHYIDIKGKINNLGKELQADINVTGEAQKLDDFQINLEELALPLRTGVQAQFKLSSSKSDNWSISDLQADLLPPALGHIQGNISNFPLQTEYRLDVEFNSLSVSNIPQLVDITQLKGRKIDISAEVKTLAGAPLFSVSNIKALITQPNTSTTMDITGSVGDIATFSDLNLSGHLTGDDFISIPEFSELDLKPNLPFDIGFSLQREKASKDLSFSIEQGQLADSDIVGEMLLKLPESLSEIPYISGKLTSNYLNIIDLMVKGERKRLFSNTPLSLDWARNFDASIAFNVKDLNGFIANIKDAKAILKLDKGFISLPGVTGKIGQGQLTWWLAIDSNTIPYSLISSMQGENLDSMALNLFGDSGLIKNGLISVDMGVSGQGGSLSEMMATAYGKFQLQLIDASLKNQNLELFGSDLILGFLSTLNPLSRQQDYLDIECGVIHFPIKKGIAYADQGIAIKTDKVTVLGGGKINLGNETLSILIKPKARKGLGLSAGTIAKIVQIGGTIDEPKIEVSSSGFFATAASLGAAAASGGWTLLAQGLLDRNKANSNVCSQTLKSPVFTSTDGREANIENGKNSNVSNK